MGKHALHTAAFRKTAGTLALLLIIASPIPAMALEGDAAAATAIGLDRTTLDLCPGDTFTLAVTVEPADAGVTWSTGDGNVATVDGGAVTAVAAGSADITAASADGALTAVCRVSVKPADIRTSVYTLDRGAGLLAGVQKFTPPSLLFSNMANDDADLSVLGQDGAAFGGLAVGTGMTVQLTVNGVARDALKIVVNGDTSGDGAVTITDYTLARLDILGLKRLEGEYMRAGDVNGDGAVSITDYTLMRMDMLGLKPIGSASTAVDLSGVTDQRVLSFLQFALTLQGKPYVWGDEGPETFDCSGFVYYCLNQTGYSVGRSTADTYGKREEWPLVAADSLQPGDLLFFHSESTPGMIGHIGVYIGNGSLIHASSSFGCIVVCPLTGWYTEKLSHARRVFT